MFYFSFSFHFPHRAQLERARVKKIASRVKTAHVAELHKHRDSERDDVQLHDREDELPEQLSASVPSPAGPADEAPADEAPPVHDSDDEADLQRKGGDSQVQKCDVCRKRYKSEAQLEVHTQSKAHQKAIKEAKKIK